MTLTLDGIRAQALILIKLQAASQANAWDYYAYSNMSALSRPTASYLLPIDITMDNHITSTVNEADALAIKIMNRYLKSMRGLLTTMKTHKQAAALLVFAMRTQPRLVTRGHVRDYIKSYQQGKMSIPTSTAPTLAMVMFSWRYPYNTRIVNQRMANDRAREILFFFDKPVGDEVSDPTPSDRLLLDSTWA